MIISLNNIPETIWMSDENYRLELSNDIASSVMQRLFNATTSQTMLNNKK